jgi:hypothetical protein
MNMKGLTEVLLVYAGTIICSVRDPHRYLARGYKEMSSILADQ